MLSCAQIVSGLAPSHTLHQCHLWAEDMLGSSALVPSGTLPSKERVPGSDKCFSISSAHGGVLFFFSSDFLFLNIRASMENITTFL